MKLTLFLLAIFFVLGCVTDKQSGEVQDEIQSEEQTESKKQARANVIRNYYYEVAEKLQLPLVWKNTSNELPVNKSKILRIEEDDTFLFGKEAGLLTLMGVVPDTSKFFTFLFYYPGDDIRPYMITFDKKGKLIEEHGTGYNCGADCGFYCIEGIFMLNKDLSFLSRHVSYQAECDDQQIDMDTTSVTYYVLERKGKIMSNGRFSEGEDEIIEDRTMPFNSPENPLREIVDEDE